MQRKDKDILFGLVFVELYIPKKYGYSSTKCLFYPFPIFSNLLKRLLFQTCIFFSQNTDWQSNAILWFEIVFFSGLFSANAILMISWTLFYIYLFHIYTTFTSNDRQYRKDSITLEVLKMYFVLFSALIRNIARGFLQGFTLPWFSAIAFHPLVQKWRIWLST